MPIDKQGLAWGVFFSVLVNGLYDVLKSAMEGNVHEEWIVASATFFVAMFVLLAFRKLLFGEKEKQLPEAIKT